MAVNTAFHTSNLHSIATERSLYSDLIKEAIQIYGHDVYYMDRLLLLKIQSWEKILFPNIERSIQ